MRRSNRPHDIDLSTLSDETEGERASRYTRNVGKALLILTSVYVLTRDAVERLLPVQQRDVALSDEHFSLRMPGVETRIDSSPESVLQEHVRRMQTVRLLRQEIRSHIQTIVDHSGAAEVALVMGKYMEKTRAAEPKAPSEYLSEMAATVSPDITASMHRLAEILQEHPELAPDLVPATRQILETLSMSDPRKYVGSIIPAQVPELDNKSMVQTTAQSFLEKEKGRGAYVDKPAVAETIPVHDLLSDPTLTILTL